MAIKKTDLYFSISAPSGELLGGINPSRYRQYVLFMLFIKYITDKYGSSSDFASPVTIPNGQGNYAYLLHVIRSMNRSEITLAEPETQRAMERVLSDIEAEIAAVEARLAKTRDLKPAMMQALLSGPERLPVSAVRAFEPEAAHA